MRCDLHIHSIASGMCNTPLLERFCKESYNRPDQVYARCKQLGMSIVTLTDHDSIDAGEILRCHKDFFLSEEVTCRIASGGSDSHALRGVGLTFTEVPEAQTVEDFFAGLRARRGKVRGADGSFAGLTADVFSITKELFQEKPAILALSPLTVLIPLIT